MNLLGLFLILAFVAILLGFQFFLADWVSQSSTNQKRDRNIILAVILTISVLLITILLSIQISGLTLYIGKNLHNKMINRVSRAPVSFYDSNPSGRILNRFSKDTAVLDIQLTLLYFFALVFALNVLVSLILSVYVIPVMGVALILLLVMMVCLKRRITVITSEALKWDAISRSPMNSLFTATIKGLMTIRAYSKEAFFMKKLEDLIDENSRALFTFYAVAQWVALRLNMLSFCYIALNIGLSILLKFWLNLDPVLVGMSVTLTMEIGSLFAFIVRQFIEIENAMTSVQRMKEYIEIPEEAPSILESDKELILSKWPAEGNIAFKEFTMRYRPEFDPVLQDLNFEVKAGMKVGVVGRTGAGKSSILQGLFRLVERDQGCIEIDG